MNVECRTRNVQVGSGASKTSNFGIPCSTFDIRHSLDPGSLRLNARTGVTSAVAQQHLLKIIFEPFEDSPHRSF